MKTKYSTPEVLVVKIATAHMIAESFTKDGSSPVSANDANVLSRRGSDVWDDED